MGRITGSNIEQFSAGSGKKLNYFTLKKDKDVARIRFLYNGAEDIDGYVVHRVKVGDYERPVNCLYERDGAIDDCPFCKAKIARQARVFIPVFNEDIGEIQIWERPNSFYGQLAGWCARYPNTVGQVLEVERNGEAGSRSTTYTFYPVGQPDDTTVNDILDDCDMDELPKVLGTKVLSKTADDMEYYLQNGEFPDRTETEAPQRRSRGTDDTSRRTARGRGDRF